MKAETRQMTQLVGVRLLPSEYRAAQQLAAAEMCTVPELLRRLLRRRFDTAWAPTPPPGEEVGNG